MIRLNRTTEYGLMALRYMNRKRKDSSCPCTSAREIADLYGLPFDITAKTLQRLRDSGLIQSTQGAKGGYHLTRALSDVSLAEFLELMEGPKSLVACQGVGIDAKGEDCGCGYGLKCEIRGVMDALNGKVRSFLGGISLAELIEERGSGTGLGSIGSGVPMAAYGGQEP